jgi:hypothetical protein
MMRRGKSSQQEDSVCRPFGVSVTSGSARYPTTLRKRREDRREAYSNAPRATENQRGGVRIMAAKKKTAKKTAKKGKKK